MQFGFDIIPSDEQILGIPEYEGIKYDPKLVLHNNIYIFKGGAGMVVTPEKKQEEEPNIVTEYVKQKRSKKPRGSSTLF